MNYVFKVFDISEMYIYIIVDFWFCKVLKMSLFNVSKIKVVSLDLYKILLVLLRPSGPFQD